MCALLSAVVTGTFAPFAGFFLGAIPGSDVHSWSRSLLLLVVSQASEHSYSSRLFRMKFVFGILTVHSYVSIAM
jgi:hypothetical protein